MPEETPLGQEQPRPDVPAPGPTLADKIDFLFKTVYPQGRGPYSYAEAAEEITKITGEKISHTTLWKLRTGRAANPTKRLIEGMAKFFQVSPAYFFDDEVAERVGQQVEVLALIRDAQIERSQLRSLGELSAEGRRVIAEMIESVARMEQERRR